MAPAPQRGEKVAFLRQRQESSVSTMRKASRAHMDSHKAQTEGLLRAEHDALRASEEAALAHMAQRLEQQDLLIAGYKRENRELRDQVERLRGGGQQAPTLSKKQSSLDVAEQTAQLEAALAQRDATIKALRDQLARLQHGLPAVDPAAHPLGHSQSLNVLPGSEQTKRSKKSTI